MLSKLWSFSKVVIWKIWSTNHMISNETTSMQIILRNAFHIEESNLWIFLLLLRIINHCCFFHLMCVSLCFSYSKTLCLAGIPMICYVTRSDVTVSWIFDELPFKSDDVHASWSCISRLRFDILMNGQEFLKYVRVRLKGQQWIPNW